MVENHYRWDFIGLSTDSKPTPATSEKVADGSTFYCSDNSKLYVFYKDQWYEKEATGGGGTTYEDFVGTDGEEAGTHGLVPAPATTDAGKYLKADGTWAEIAVGEGVVELTSADYNYKYNSGGDANDMIAPWLLNSGFYRIKSGTAYKVGTNEAGSPFVPAEDTIIIVGSRYGTGYKPFIHIGYGTILYGGVWDDSGSISNAYRNLGGRKYVFLTGYSIENNLTSSSDDRVLSAAQGKVLNDKIGNLSSLTTTDKTSIVAAINELAARL